MIDLSEFFYFVQIVDRGGFNAAGRALHVPKSTISHRIHNLETKLGVRLLTRTSRHVCMTSAGSEFYRHALTVLREVDQAEAAMREWLTESAGSVRFTAAVAVTQFAMREMVADFLVRRPKVKVVAHATPDLVDIVGDGYDFAVRSHFGPLPDSTLIRRTLAETPWYLFAGASFFESHPAPQGPQDLAGLPALQVLRAGPGAEVGPAWRLAREGQRDEVIVPLAPLLLSDDLVSLKKAAAAGLGIVALPGYVCRSELQSGELRRVLPEWSAGVSVLSALIPDRRGVLPSVRAFIDHIAAEFPKAVRLE
jgi:DNA-binding transcriptional LysR family regulator